MFTYLLFSRFPRSFLRGAADRPSAAGVPDKAGLPWDPSRRSKEQRGCGAGQAALSKNTLTLSHLQTQANSQNHSEWILHSLNGDSERWERAGNIKALRQMRIFLSPVDTESVMGSGGPLFFFFFNIKSFSKGIPICLRFHPGILIAEVCHKDVRKRSSLRRAEQSSRSQQP